MATENMIKQSLSQFTVDFYDKIITAQGDSLGNVFVSPLSIYTAMVMTMAGTDGKTRTEIENTLRIPKQLLATCPHKQVGTTLQKFFKPSEDIQLSLANRLFVIKPVSMVEQFKQILDKDYNASIEQISSLPSYEAKRQHINKWTSENTEQKITELLPTDAIDEDTVLALVNALYFKGKSELGKWENQFDAVDTIRGDFTCFGGEKMDIMMMHVEAHFPYEELTDWAAQAVRLPFKGTDWQMLVVLPLEASGLPNVLDRLRKPGALQDLLKKSFHETELNLFLPKFKLSHCDPVNAKALLKQCGINTVFDPYTADLTKMCNSNQSYVSDVFHKAILE
ncbi:serpin B, partial [Paragonimus westermani]